ncbi:hypothetical protein AURDEDRAFT_51653 [Auricularia subglabra TFB-10046 SS5]|nr:hypothetical protein AURDEDRAFT_51653 [Auricularia subglabra TFB-10046 SS5]
MSRITIEVCVDSLESATAAVTGGADRLEVCANLGAGGGATPSIGLIRTLKRRFPDTPLMAMVRPRMGDFVYTDEELEIMLEDIAAFREVGVAGVVLGVLTAEGRVDVERSRRAVDMTLDVVDGTLSPPQACFAGRCSGGQVKALTGLRTLKELAERSSGLKILPGSGVNAFTVDGMLRPLLPLGVREVHMSGGVWLNSAVHEEARPEGMDMGGWQVWRTLESNVKAVRDTVDALI